MIRGSFSIELATTPAFPLFELQRLPADPDEKDDLTLLARPPPRAHGYFPLGQHPHSVPLLPPLDGPDVSERVANPKHGVHLKSGADGKRQISRQATVTFYGNSKLEEACACLYPSIASV